MKIVLSIFLASLMVLSFTSCGGDSIEETQDDKITKVDDNSSSIIEPTVESMVLNQSYTLAIGEEIQRVTEDTKLKITQNSEDDEAVYILVEGEAEILRN